MVLWGAKSTKRLPQFRDSSKKGYRDLIRFPPMVQSFGKEAAKGERGKELYRGKSTTNNRKGKEKRKIFRSSDFIGNTKGPQLL